MRPLLSKFKFQIHTGNEYRELSATLYSIVVLTAFSGIDTERNKGDITPIEVLYWQ